ncbi:MAG TPA: RtcB family protein [Hyphomicrobiaceae bacterium]|nr:RtcB family protein [Hyphomicrobiaceae bacterium]
MHPKLERLDASRIKIRARADLDITLFANDGVFLDPASVEEMVSFAGLVDTIEALNARRFFGDEPAHLERVVLTPDFHRAAGIPVGTVLDARGFVLPKAVGTDIGCGMRLLATDITADEFAGLGPGLEERLRYIFFEGGRDIALSASQRRGIFGEGLQGLLGASEQLKERRVRATGGSAGGRGKDTAATASSRSPTR